MGSGQRSAQRPRRTRLAIGAASAVGAIVAATVAWPSVQAASADSPLVRAAVAKAVASADDGNGPLGAIDSNSSTRWSAKGDGQWIRLDLGSAQTVGLVKIAFFGGDTRQANFDLQVSDDAASWTSVWSGSSAGAAGLETFDITDVSARYVRYLGHGNSANTWNALTDLQVYVESRPSQRVAVDADGGVTEVAYPNGDQLPDFSHVGYAAGGAALPTAEVKATVSPADGDDAAAIQTAIDEVSALEVGPDGLRGAVLLTKGTYEVSGSLRIATSGVVLRGEGDGPTGTVVKASGTAARNLITAAGTGKRTETAGTRQAITASYVPVGAHTFSVADGSSFAVGDEVAVVRTPNQEWIDALGMDACDSIGTSYDTADKDGSTCLSGTVWTPASRTIHYERHITAVDGNEITVDSPVVEAFQQEFGGGAVYGYTFPGRINHVGIEHLRAESAFASATDEAHANWMISMTNVENAWVRNVTSLYFVQGTMFLGGGARYITVQDSASLDHKSLITGGRRYPFNLNGASHVLIMRVRTGQARHDFVSGANSPGPNVFLDSRAEDSRSEVGPHHRWATGTLFDNIVHSSSNGKQIIGTYNRGNSGSGHGWSGAYQVFYNCVGDTQRVANPPHARNWSIGCRVKKKEGDGDYDAVGGPVAPWSLYLQQLRDRLGQEALTNIGY